MPPSATASRSANQMYLPRCGWVKWLHGSSTGEDLLKIRRSKLKSLKAEALIFMKKEFETEDQKVGLLTERKLVMVGRARPPGFRTTLPLPNGHRRSAVRSDWGC